MAGHRHLPGHVRRHDPAEVEALSRPGRQAREQPSTAEVERARQEQRRRSRRWWLVGTALALVAAVVVAVSLTRGPLSQHLPWVDPQAENPFAGREL